MKHYVECPCGQVDWNRAMVSRDVAIERLQTQVAKKDALLDKARKALEVGNEIRFNNNTGRVIEATWLRWQDALREALAALDADGKAG